MFVRSSGLMYGKNTIFRKVCDPSQDTRFSLAQSRCSCGHLNSFIGFFLGLMVLVRKLVRRVGRRKSSRLENESQDSQSPSPHCAKKLSRVFVSDSWALLQILLHIPVVSWEQKVLPKLATVCDWFSQPSARMRSKFDLADKLPTHITWFLDS